MNKKILRAMTDIDSDLIAAADKRKTKGRGVWIRTLAAAACICLIITAAIVAMPKDTPDVSLPPVPEVSDSYIGNVSAPEVSNDPVSEYIPDDQSTDEPTPPEIPIYDDPLYSAFRIADIFPTGSLSSAATPTNNYVYVPEATKLNVKPLPAEEYTKLYEVTEDCGKANDESELQKFIKRIIPKLARALGIDTPEFEFKYNQFDEEIYASEKADDYYIAVTQNRYYNRIFIGNLNSESMPDRGNIQLYGKLVAVDQTKTDAEILKSLDLVKYYLCEVFGKNLDMTISRTYSNRGEYSVMTMTVYIYDIASGIDPATGTPNSDYIKIYFDNTKELQSGEEVGARMENASIAFYKRRTGSDDVFENIAYQKLVTLDRAEQMLKEGKVFGFHVCPLCKSEDGSYAFENGYDFVSFEYNANKTVSIPFYVFYKNVGTSENGNLIYSKAYVPAIELDGMDAYFDSQQQFHTEIPDAPVA